MKKQKGKALAIWGIALGWFAPIVGIILGILAKGRATNQSVQTLGTIAIAESIAFWILWILLLI